MHVAHIVYGMNLWVKATHSLCPSACHFAGPAFRGRAQIAVLSAAQCTYGTIDRKDAQTGGPGDADPFSAPQL